MHRRQFLAATGVAAAALSRSVQVLAAEQQTGQDSVSRGLLDAFLALPGNKSVQVDIDRPHGLRRVAYQPDSPLFCGSCFKTFVLATYLQGVEAGTLTESEQLPIDDSIRSVGGGVFEFLTGTASARARAGSHDRAQRQHRHRCRHAARRCRQGARLHPGSRSDAGAHPRQHAPFLFLCRATRPAPTWAGRDCRPCRPASLAGHCGRPSTTSRPWCARPASSSRTTSERWRASSSARTSAHRVQADPGDGRRHPARRSGRHARLSKGGSISWDGFYCLAVAGQMIVGATPVTFCLNLNWTEGDGGEAKVTEAYRQATAEVLGQVQREVLKG